MYQNIINSFRGCAQCAQCANVTDSGRRKLPPLQSIPVDRPFQIVGLDIMALPLTAHGNRYANVFQDMFTKWPMVYAVPERISKLLTQEIVPMYRVPEAYVFNGSKNQSAVLS